MTLVTPADHPYLEDLERERVRWDELIHLCATIPVAARERPGYYADSGWSVKDMLAHIGTWLAEGKSRIERIHGGTYEREEMDIDALNARFLAAMRDRPWSDVWVQANAARTLLLRAWFELTQQTEDADWWLRKVGPDHYEQHLERLRDWTAALRAKPAG